MSRGGSPVFYNAHSLHFVSLQLYVTTVIGIRNQLGGAAALRPRP